MKTLTNIEKFEKALNENKFTMSEELTMIKLLVAKYNFISKSQYARKQDVTPQGVLARLKRNSDPYIEMIGKIFIIN